MNTRSFALAALVTTLLAVAPAGAAPKRGEVTPEFELTAIDGSSVSEAQLAENGLNVLTFWSPDSKSSRELILALQDLVRENPDANVRVIAVAKEPAEEVEKFAKTHGLSITLCTDSDGSIMGLFGAGAVLPQTFVVAPDRRVAAVVSGGGASSQRVLLAVAEKEFSRGNDATSEKIFAKVAAAEPENVEARAGKAFALARQGKLERAEEEFRTIESMGPSGRRRSIEGLATVALANGDIALARATAEKAPKDSGWADVVRGEALAREGKSEEAKRAFGDAANKDADFSWQKATAFTNLARVDGDGGGEILERAIAEEPFLVAARSDKAVALERLGDLEGARATLAVAKTMAPQDDMIVALLRRIERHEAEKVSIERRKLADKIVGELVASWKAGELPEPPGEWTPRRLVVSLLDVRDELGATARAGYGDVLLSQLGVELSRTGRIEVVDREKIDALMQELGLGTSDLADSSTRLRLGRVFAAAAIGTGGLYPAGPSGRLELRWIDTETTAIRFHVSETLPSPETMRPFVEKVASTIHDQLRKEYPLKGKIAGTEGRSVLVGIGAKHGAATGSVFRVVEKGKPVEVDGEILGYRNETIGKVRLTSVEDGFSTASPIEGSGFAKGQLVVEDVP